MTHDRKSPQNKTPAPIRVSMISLGCAKNLVDSEVILGNVGAEGLAITSRPEDADVILINTCGFIQHARDESLQTIRQMCDLKSASPEPKKVVVTGCLGQRYGEEVRRQAPGVDAIIGLGEYRDIGATIRGLVAEKRGGDLLRLGDPNRACNAEVGRFRLTPRHYAYVKVSEGCDNPCTFCAIPSIRGRFRSKPIQMILEEVRELVASGAREIILISQDTTSYGIDLTSRFDLPRLLESLSAVDGVEWIRVLYLYPSFLNDEMIESIAGIEKVVKYIDIPLQHISDRMLRRMGRRLNEAKTRRLLEELRQRIPGLYLRTTFLVGFPGEDESDFEVLRAFVREFRFERLGVFTYSAEDGTPAAGFKEQVPPEVRERRAAEIMLVQQAGAFLQNRSRKGESVTALVDDECNEAAGQRRSLRARSYGEAPEIDPCIIIQAPPRADAGGTVETGTSRGRVNSRAPRRRGAPRPGDFVRCRITGSRDYDLLATLVAPA